MQSWWSHLVYSNQLPRLASTSRLFKQLKKSSIFLIPAWVIAIFRGGVISALMLVASVVISYFLPPTRTDITHLFYSSHPTKRLHQSRCGALQKTFDGYTSVDSVSRFVIEAILAVAFVFLWPGVWSLLWALVVAAMFEVLISRFISLRPKISLFLGTS